MYCEPCAYAKSQLGQLPIIGTALNVSQFISGILNPEDTKRKAAIDRRTALALGGDVGSALVVRCWAGIPTPELNNYPILAKDVGVNAAGDNCGMATSAAKQYAKMQWDRIQLQPQIADGLVKLGISITGAAAPYSPLAQQTARTAAIGTAAAVALGGGLLFLMARRRRS